MRELSNELAAVIEEGREVVTVALAVLDNELAVAEPVGFSER